MPQRNAFPGLIFVILFGLGLLVAYPAGNAGDYGASVTIAVLSFVVAGDRRRLDQDRQSVGARRRPAARPLPRARRARAVLHHPDHRHGAVLDRHPRDRQRFQGGEDADTRHRAGRRRRRAVLEGGRPAEGGARRRRVRGRDQLGGADGAARRDRQDDARRHAGGPREDQRGTAADHRRAHRAVGRSTSSRSR